MDPFEDTDSMMHNMKVRKPYRRKLNKIILTKSNKKTLIQPHSTNSPWKNSFKKFPIQKLTEQFQVKKVIKMLKKCTRCAQIGCIRLCNGPLQTKTTLNTPPSFTGRRNSRPPLSLSSQKMTCSPSSEMLFIVTMTCQKS